MIRQLAGVHDFLEPIRERVAAAKEEFNAYIAQPRTDEARLQLRRRLAAGAIGTFVLAGGTAYAAAISSEQTYSEASPNEAVGVVGDLFADVMLLRAGVFLVRARGSLDWASLPDVTAPTRILHEDNEHQAAA